MNSVSSQLASLRVPRSVTNNVPNREFSEQLSHNLNRVFTIFEFDSDLKSLEEELRRECSISITVSFAHFIRNLNIG